MDTPVDKTDPAYLAAHPLRETMEPLIAQYGLSMEAAEAIAAAGFTPEETALAAQGLKAGLSLHVVLATLHAGRSISQLGEKLKARGEAQDRKKKAAPPPHRPYWQGPRGRPDRSRDHLN